MWGSTDPTNLKRLAITQKRVVRIVNKDAFSAHTDPLFAELKLFKVDQIFLLQVASFMFRFENNLLPPFFDYDLHTSMLFDKFTCITPGPLQFVLYSTS